MKFAPAARSLASLVGYIRSAPFDTSTAEGRAAERYRRAAIGALANIAARLAGVLLVILTVYVAAPYLGQVRFGVWATFASLAAMLSFLDLGVGNALVNRVGQKSAAGELEELTRLVSGGVGWLALIGVCASVALSGAAAVIPWGALLKLNDPVLADEARFAAFVFSCVFGIHILSSGALKILAGQQRSHEAHIVSGAGALLACAMVVWAAQHQAGVPVLLAAGFGVQAAVGVLVLLLLRRRGLLRIRDVPSSMSLERKWLLGAGFLFFLLQIGTMVGWGSDALIVASVSGPAEVAVFVVAQKLFQFAAQPIAVVNAPLWAAYADASARGERSFIRRTLVRSTVGSALFAGLMVVVLCLVAPWVVPYWTQGAIAVPMSLIYLLAVWTLFEACGTAFGMYLNGTGVIREQVGVVLLFCAVALPMKIVATVYAGASGLVLATIVAYLLAVVLPYATVLRRRAFQPLVQQAQ